MAEAIIDRLEPIDVEHQHGERSAAQPRRGNRGLQLRIEMAAIVEAGDRIDEGRLLCRPRLGR